MLAALAKTGTKVDQIDFSSRFDGLLIRQLVVQNQCLLTDLAHILVSITSITYSIA